MSGRKTDNFQGIVERRGLKYNANDVKGANLNYFKMGISYIHFLLFTPRISNFDFSEINGYKIEIFKDIQQREYKAHTQVSTTGVRNCMQMALFLAVCIMAKKKHQCKSCLEAYNPRGGI